MKAVGYEVTCMIYQESEKSDFGMVNFKVPVKNRVRPCDVCPVKKKCVNRGKAYPLHYYRDSQYLHNSIKKLSKLPTFTARIIASDIFGRGFYVVTEHISVDGIPVVVRYE